MPHRRSERLGPKKTSRRHVHDTPWYESRRGRARVSGRGGETSMTRQKWIRGYLEQLAFATLETSRNLRLRPLFRALLRHAAGTIVAMWHSSAWPLRTDAKRRAL